MTCLKETLDGGVTGRLVSSSLEELRLEIGLPGWTTDYDFSKIGHLAADSWIKTVWQFASRFKIELRDSEAQLQLRRTNDHFLMAEFGRHFQGADLLALNICRMFLHSVTLADLCTVDGKAVTIDAWQGQRNPACGLEIEWPRVQRSLPESF
jgi:hypothetical protein